MAKLSKSEKISLAVFKDHVSKNDRGDMWLGYRPTVFVSKKDNKKERRRDAKAICRA